ncbi:hypothetical protein EB118_19340 [bacterium]|nr:hypothetical protein [bacterium]
MPNWCMNNLTISHDDNAKLQEFVDAYNSGNTCEHYLPCPKDENGNYIEDQGHPDYWYTWQCNNWGTKWDFGKEDHHDLAKVEGGNVVVSFNSAWSPPIQFYEKLVELDYNVRGSYFEPGMGYCGIWDNGVDNYIEYSHADDPADVIPVALWNEYEMDEFFEMMEDDV